ncbi:MAG: DUF1559 domain-containing protein [Planctomycetales bacterium]|nr:DUF1559 domain-containing protein [Planctomycetales bacterium]
MCKSQTHQGFTLIELLVVIVSVGLLMTLLLSALQSAREAARRTSCINKLKQIGIALGAYESANQYLPPGGVMYKPCCDNESYTTWTIELLPHLDHPGLFARYRQDEYNESVANRSVVSSFVGEYVCPSEPNVDQAVRPDSGPGARFKWMPGSYRAMTGRAERGNWFGNYFKGSWPLPLSYRGPMHTVGNSGPTRGRTSKLKPVRLSEIRDGQSHTIAVGERSLELPDNRQRRTLWAYSYGSYNKSAAYLQRRIFWRDYERCTNPDPPKVYHSMPCKHGWSSYHESVTNFLYCDGAVRSLATLEVDLDVFVAQATIDGREID